MRPLRLVILDQTTLPRNELARSQHTWYWRCAPASPILGSRVLELLLAPDPQHPVVVAFYTSRCKCRPRQ